MHQKVSRYYFTQTKYLFHCHVKIKIPLSAGQALLADCFDVLEQIDRAYNSYQPGSYFDRINKNAGQWVRVDSPTIQLLQTIQQVQECTQGAYHIAVMPLLKLWGFYNTAGLQQLPSAPAIQGVVEQIQKQKIEIRGLDVRISPHTTVLTASFLKAYAVDQLLVFLKANQVTAALINAGGSTIAALNDEQQSTWTIRIPHPQHLTQDWQEIQISNCCLSLSGRKAHFVDYQQVEYGHILNAATGYPSRNWQAVVTSKSALWSDICSTASLAMDEIPTHTQAMKQLMEIDSFAHYLIPNLWDEKVPDQFFKIYQ